jgi:toxin-antitoxin system PIN domain toxin
MRCVDVNVLVYAHRPESPDHHVHLDWLDRARRASEPLGLIDVVASGFLRVVTHPGVFKEPSPLSIAIDFIDAVRSSPATAAVGPGERHWAIFSDLCRTTDAAGNRIPDAFLAAVAIEHNARWVTADKGFARFPGIRLEHPSDG